MGPKRRRIVGIDDQAAGGTEKQSVKRYRGWCWTFNNYTPADIERILQIPCKFVCFQGEIAPTTGTKHLQGYIYFDNARPMSSVKKAIGGNPHLGFQRGTVDQAIDYCKKKDSADPDCPYVERGTRPSPQGSRTDLLQVSLAIKAGKSSRDIFEQFPVEFIKYQRGITGAIAVAAQERSWKTVVHWYYGPTGTCKSRLAYDEAQTLIEQGEYSNPVYTKSNEHNWWDGYSGNEIVLIDDYRPNLCHFSTLLTLLDRYPTKVQYKGGISSFLARHVFITSNKHYNDHWHNRTTEDIAQLARRVEHVRQFGIQNNHAFYCENNLLTFLLYNLK